MVAGPGFEPAGASRVGAQTARPVIGIRFAVNRLRFPDRPQIFPVTRLGNSVAKQLNFTPKAEAPSLSQNRKWQISLYFPV